jgi:hypothetical protein
MKAELQGQCVGIVVSKAHWDVAVEGCRGVRRFSTEFFGHYWLKDEKPQRVAPDVACFDDSVAGHGSFVRIAGMAN